MISIRAQIPETGVRVDRFLAQQFPDYTRTFLKKLIQSGKIKRNNSIISKPSTAILDGDTVTIESLEREKRSVSVDGYQGFFAKNTLFTHKDFFVINKPVGLIAHPACEEAPVITLADLIVDEYPEIALVGEPERPGIVHRLDKDTSGLMLIARTQHGYETFTTLFKNRKIKKTYLALVKGNPTEDGSITSPIARNPVIPRKMTTKIIHGRESHTDYTVIKHFDRYALLKVQPHTGRTHQIRVHMDSIGHTIIGDTVYGHLSKADKKLIKRQALHAHQLTFEFDGEQYNFTCPLPEDMQKLTEN